MILSLSWLFLQPKKKIRDLPTKAKKPQIHAAIFSCEWAAWLLPVLAFVRYIFSCGWH
jgi:hypothetical protein